MTCPHCAHFSETTFPELKKRYIDTGKVRFIFREFPLDPLAAAAFMLARCAGKDKYFPMIETLFHQQTRLGGAEAAAAAARDRQAGRLHPADASRRAWRISKLLDGIETVRDRAAEKFGVSSTPTFFINGKKFARRALDRGAGEGDRALSQGVIRVFSLARQPLRGARRPRRRRRYTASFALENSAQSLLPESAAPIHSPRRCGKSESLSTHGLGPSLDRFAVAARLSAVGRCRQA